MIGDEPARHGKGASVTAARRKLRVLHIANWYPNRWSAIEGKFVAAQFERFAAATDAKLVNVQLRVDDRHWLRVERAQFEPGRSAVYLLTRLRSERIHALLITILLLYVLATERAWRWDVLHFHIAWPLLAYAHIWRKAIRKPIVVSEHWSAYHHQFHLADDAPALERLRRPFRQGLPVIAVSQALLADIRRFSGDAAFPGYVLPNYVPLHGVSPGSRAVPVLFAVNSWGAIKDPMPMLHGLALAADNGASFALVLGGLGSEIEAMRSFVGSSSLSGRTEFRGWMTGEEIAGQLAQSDGYLFSSRYETFSVACAEALGAGVPLLGPFIPAIAEYAGEGDWRRVETRDAEGWRSAATAFLETHAAGRFDRQAIAARASNRFSEEELVTGYLAILDSIVAAARNSAPQDADAREKEERGA